MIPSFIFRPVSCRLIILIPHVFQTRITTTIPVELPDTIQLQVTTTPTSLSMQAPPPSLNLQPTQALTLTSPFFTASVPRQRGRGGNRRLQLLPPGVSLSSGKNISFCPICRLGFSQPGNMKRHLRTHTGEKPYSCPHCKAAFSQTTHLKRHILTHTGERPHKCQHCSATFTRKNTLSTHMTIFHPEHSHKVLLNLDTHGLKTDGSI